jgi:hypothetical protein
MLVPIHARPRACVLRRLPPPSPPLRRPRLLQRSGRVVGARRPCRGLWLLLAQGEAGGERQGFDCRALLWGFEVHQRLARREGRSEGWWGTAALAAPGIAGKGLDGWVLRGGGWGGVVKPVAALGAEAAGSLL